MNLKILFGLFLIVVSSGKPVAKLPGYSGPELIMESGYINVNSTRDSNLFFWLIKAEEESGKKPLIFWFQGGPGCSSVSGLFSENGPFRVTGDGTKLEYSDLSWTKFANMVWFEQPACVGFSYTDNCKKDNSTSDDQAAQDNYAFIQKFLEIYPEFKDRDTYLTGESYAGIYIPTVTDLILSDSSTQIYKQFSGFAAGNPVMNCQSQQEYEIHMFGLLYWHGLVSYSNFNNWTNTHGCDNPKKTKGEACQWILQNSINQVGVIEQALKRKREPGAEAEKNWPSLDPDDLYYDFCVGNASLDFSLHTEKPGTCDDSGQQLVTYLNNPDVQKAINAKPVKWGICAGIDYSTTNPNMVPLYQGFPKKKPGVKLMVYSGDIDILTVPFAMTMPCVSQIGAKPMDDWQPWFVNYATAGYVETYQGYTYATLKGAGHEAPEYQPVNAWQMINRFVTSGKLTDPAHVPPATAKQQPLRQGDILRKLGLAKDLLN